MFITICFYLLFIIFSLTFIFFSFNYFLYRVQWALAFKYLTGIE